MAKIKRDLGNDTYIDVLIDAARHGAPPEHFPEPGVKAGTWRKAKPTRFLRDLDEGPEVKGDGAPADFKSATIWDSQEEGLQIYIGRRAATWRYFRQSRDHGNRKHVYKNIGSFDRGSVHPYVLNPNPAVHEPKIHRSPKHVSCDDARKMARIYAGKIEEGTQGPNAKEGPTFAQAFTGGFLNENGEAVTGYLEYLKAHGKTDRWAYNVERLYETILKAEWATWSLIEMSKHSVKFKNWYLGLSDNPTNANHCARIVRALYRRAAAHDSRLPRDRDPACAIGKQEWHTEARKQKGMKGSQFHDWHEAWKAIPSATHRAYHLVNLLIGARPGQLVECHWRDLDLEANEFTMPDAVKNSSETRNDITVPITPEIIAAFDLARNDPDRPNKEGTGPDDLIFPGCWNNRGRDKLPAKGHALRRTQKTIAEDHCGVPEQISEFLQGRIPAGMSPRYLLKFARTEGPKIIEAQQEISRTIMTLLRAKPKQKKRAA